MDLGSHDLPVRTAVSLDESHQGAKLSLEFFGGSDLVRGTFF
jgi:hypothetical protein